MIGPTWFPWRRRSEPCIVNVSIGSWYPKGQVRLARSLRTVGYKGEFLAWKNAYPPEAPTVQERPYSFKPFAFRAAQAWGHRYVLWIDSSMYAIRSVEPLFEEIRNRGYLLFDNVGSTVGEWSSDRSLQLMGIDRTEAFRVPQIMSGILGLDLFSPTCLSFLHEWERHARLGTFSGSRSNEDGSVSADPRVKGHRHDQTVASVIAHRLGMRDRVDPYSTYMIYDEFRAIHPELETTVLICKGGL